MANKGKYDISFLGEFKDKSLEREFFNFDMSHYTKVVGPVALIYGLIYMMFLVSDYFDIDNTNAFIKILIVRLLFLAASIAMFFVVKRLKNYLHLSYLITIYEVLAIIGFIIIIDAYETLTLLFFFSVMAMTLAIYIIPNKLLYSQIISIFLCSSFFKLHAHNIEGMETSTLLKVGTYYLIMIVYCNIWAYLNNFYKRKQFIDRRELHRVSITDSLTGIYNRSKFNTELVQWIDYCNRYNNPLSLVMFDIDDFKRINDSHGHLIGDSVIGSIAETIKNTIRSTDVFARWGGDEFVILLPNTDINQAHGLIERMRICIQDNKFAKSENITCSFGLVELKENEDLQSFLQRADNRLYGAKDCGKNAVVWDDSSLCEPNY